MFKTLTTRWQQKHRTTGYPDGPGPELPGRFRGRLSIQPGLCPPGCALCQAACPTGALLKPAQGQALLDLGKCLFCPDCMQACPEQAITFSRDHRLAVRRREDLLLRGGQELALAQALDRKMLWLFKRSLRLRQVSAGGCAACEADVNVLNTIGWDLSRFGIQFVASPRHADGLLITGPVTENMQAALLNAYQALPEPKIVIAVGACAISGGPYAGQAEQMNGAASCVPVDLFIPGCPPHPLTTLDGLLRLLDRIGDAGKARQ
jgi:Ni,Fe-hydrogenase III small subunit/ferredoxin